jgi:hypothetical protein
MEQRSLFYGSESLNPVPELKRAMSLALKQSRLSRSQAADRMNAHITVERLRTRGKDGLVTEDMINKWLAPESAEVIPTKLVKIFGTVMGSPALAQTLAPEGYRVIGPQELLLLEYGRAQMEKRKVSRRERRLAEQIEEMG